MAEILLLAKPLDSKVAFLSAMSVAIHTGRKVPETIMELCAGMGYHPKKYTPKKLGTFVW